VASTAVIRTTSDATAADVATVLNPATGENVATATISATLRKGC